MTHSEYMATSSSMAVMKRLVMQDGFHACTSETFLLLVVQFGYPRLPHDTECVNICSLWNKRDDLSSSTTDHEQFHHTR